MANRRTIVLSTVAMSLVVALAVWAGSRLSTSDISQENEALQSHLASIEAEYSKLQSAYDALEAQFSQL
ncbi:MAG: hypothetical protein ISS52_05035 [Dehalococcoidia bacterium]|nr:hypothetical protein [Dehalococcoidia bacterium]